MENENLYYFKVNKEDGNDCIFYLYLFYCKYVDSC